MYCPDRAPASRQVRRCGGVLALIAVSASALACSLHVRPTLPDAVMMELWQPPADLPSRDLYGGPGGRDLAPSPNGRYTFVSVKSSGSNPGYDVKDAQGRIWSVKLGVESRTEVVVSRLVWAAGYHQPLVYYVPRWTLVRDGRAIPQPAGRFRLESETQKKVGEWSWRDNPFLGTRPMAGLFVLMVLVNNWDLSTVQNAVYAVGGDDGGSRVRYMVRDLGASLGRTRWLALSTKDDPAGFEGEPFIREIDGGRVRFQYQGAFKEPQLHAGVTIDDVHWVCGLLGRLSEDQWHDAFRAGGFTQEETNRYVRRLRQKVAEGLDLQRTAPTAHIRAGDVSPTAPTLDDARP